MLGACTGDSASADLAAIGDVFAKGGDIFVIDIGHLVATEAARLLLELLISAAAFAPLFFGSRRALLFLAPIMVLLFGPCSSTLTS